MSSWSEQYLLHSTNPKVYVFTEHHYISYHEVEGSLFNTREGLKSRQRVIVSFRHRPSLVLDYSLCWVSLAI